jgi:hypothetical protein
MKWITRSHVHVDRVACPWLITRFIDNGATFVFTALKSIHRFAKETGAIPFDVEGVELGHKEGRCSFESIIKEYGLNDPALLRMAKIIHSADIAEDIEKDPIARGLEAIAQGYSIRYPKDEENLQNQYMVYDSLYAWCRMEVIKDKETKKIVNEKTH